MASAGSADDLRHMARALELARQGEGLVEPNPMVGCVLVRDGKAVGEGWHRRFGGPHAEVEAIAAAKDAAHGATAYVTLEPCVHVGKTPPCTRALIDAGVARVVVACRDPNPQVDGAGLRELERAGVAVEIGGGAVEAADLIAPFTKLTKHGRPWVIAKWAMTLDGKLAARTGDSRWISGEASRARAHQLRGRVDAILVGRRTVEQDDPLLTARPPGLRVPIRLVLDSRATLRLNCQLIRTAGEAPVVIAAGPDADAARCEELRARGVEVWQFAAARHQDRCLELLDELGRRHLTNLLVEGGAQVLGALFDAGAVDEIHAFIAPRVIGGPAPSPVAGAGRPDMAHALNLPHPIIEQLGEDAYIHGRLR